VAQPEGRREGEGGGEKDTVGSRGGASRWPYSPAAELHKAIPRGRGDPRSIRPGGEGKGGLALSSPPPPAFPVDLPGRGHRGGN
jgi:hypothetical protein